MITYNYCCIQDNCDSKTIQSKDKKPKCSQCGNKLKRLGVSTNISHIGTQESNNIR